MAETSGGDLPDGTSEIFFAGGLDTNFAKLPVGQISRPVSARCANRSRNCEAIGFLRAFQQPRQMFFSLAVVRASSAMNGALYAARDASLSTASGFFVFGGDAAS